MNFPHHKRESVTHGKSPGNGITPIHMSSDPLATEGEATPGPDDQNPYDEAEYEQAKQATIGPKSPTSGGDPFVFDDVGEVLPGLEMPDLGSGPRF